jgi:phosphoglycolate phosphatase
MKLFLFDIDGTLIDSGGAGTRSLNLAFKQLFSIDDGFEGINMAGKTDTQIIKEGLNKHDLPLKFVDKVINAYIENLRKEINNDNKHIKPGVSELLERLKRKRSSATGLLTGNLEPGARIKLEPFGLNKYFPSGAFGSDNENRNMLLPIAVKRYKDLFNKNFKHEDCFVIGDTPLDIECAKIYGAYSIGVATGPYTIEHLKSAGADYVIDNLANNDFLLWLKDTLNLRGEF